MCHNLHVNLFQKFKRLCKKDFPEINIRRQLLDYFLPGIINITSDYGIIIIETLPPNASSQLSHQIEYKQMLEIDFLKFFVECIISIQKQKLTKSKF